jgi:peptidoglycan-associated lipoprotein
MMRVPNLLALLAVAAVAAACGGKPEPEQPAPEPTVTTPTVNQDSIDAARRAADEEARRRAAEEEARRRGADAAGTLRAELSSMINFGYNEADIRAEDQSNLDRKAAILQANPGLRVRISGHADDRGSDEYNLALGNRRAAAAKRYLENKGIDPARIEVISYGEERPLAQGADEASWAQNRRDEFEPTGGADSLKAPT